MCNSPIYSIYINRSQIKPVQRIIFTFYDKIINHKAKIKKWHLRYFTPYHLNIDVVIFSL